MEELPPEYLRGIELFNEGRYFECHEVWERIWLQAEGVQREFLHAMIQIAASLLHFQRGNLKGAASIDERARGKLAAMPPVVMQLDTRELARELETFHSTGQASWPQIKLNR
jgi:hypothetical protein